MFAATCSGMPLLEEISASLVDAAVWVFAFTLKAHLV